MAKTRTIKNYKELSKLETFLERYRYLRIAQLVGDSTFDEFRWLNQGFYHSTEWRRLRDIVIVRDNGCDLGVSNLPILDRIIVHHINPLTVYDIENMTELVTNPDFLICCTNNTHQAIHYGDESLLPQEYEPRRPNDTCPWK